MLNPLVPIAIIGWLAAGPVLVVLLGARRGMLAAILLGWLFLPVASISVAAMPDISKHLVVVSSALLGVLLIEPSRLANFRPRWIDAPMAVWCVIPLASSLSNNLGIWDSASAVLHQTITWGVPWLLGRAYLGDAPGIRDLALTIVIGGLIYLPFCLWEIRMSPNLHHYVYGYHQHAFIQTRRFGGWRPMVFMEHGLAVALFMAAAALLATWMWATRAERQIFGVPLALPAIALLVTTVLCKSAGAIVLLAVFLTVLLACRAARLRLPLLAILAIAPLYMSARTTGVWHGEHLVNAVAAVAPARSSSLQSRFDAENILAERALERPIFGWGGWGRSRAANASGAKAAVTDGFWIITLGQRGLAGLGAVTIIMLTPALLLLTRIPARRLFSAQAAPYLALGMVTLMFALDSLLNAMLNPLWVLAMGALGGAMTNPTPQPIRRRTPPAPQGSAA